MKFKIVLIISSIIFLFPINTGAAGIYLGSYAPDENQSINVSIPVRNIEAEEIKVYLQNNYFVSKSKKINSENLKIIAQNKLFPLSNKILKLEKNNLILRGIINFKFDLKSRYEPGVYENILYLNSKQGVDKYTIVFEIRPWKKIVKGDQSSAIINNLNDRTHELYSSGQQKLIINSNTNWKLKVVLNDGCQDGISIKIDADCESMKSANFNENFKLIESQEVVVASGCSTEFLDTKRVEIFYQFRIDDFKKVKAGTKEYQFKFTLE